MFMSKSSEEDIQKDKKNLIDELRINARENISIIAEKLNFSR